MSAFQHNIPNLARKSGHSPQNVCQDSGMTCEDGMNLMRKLESDQMQMTPRIWRTASKVPKELLIAKVWGVISVPLTEKESAVTN